MVFIRLLSTFTPESKCQHYLGELKIADQVIVPKEPISNDFLEQLYQTKYCDDVIEDFRAIDKVLKLTLLGPHIITIYHHKLIHLLSNRDLELQHSLSVYREVLELLNDKGPENYSATIISFHHLCLNVIAALTQFNHYHRNAELCMQVAEDINQAVWHVSELQINDQSAVIHTGMREQIVTAITSIVSLTRMRDYQYLLGLIDELDRYLSMPSSNNPASALNYVQASVALAHGFRSQNDYDAFRTIYRRCVEYAEQFPSKEIVAALGMIHIQLYRNDVNYYTTADKCQFLSSAIMLAMKFPDEDVGLLQSVILELIGAYRSAMQNHEMEFANEHFETALSLISQAGNFEYSLNKRVWCCDLVKIGLDAQIESNLPLDSTVRALQILHDSPVVAFNQCLHQVLSELFSQAHRAANQGETEIFERCKNCLRVLLPYFNVTSSLLEALPSN